MASIKGASVMGDAIDLRVIGHVIGADEVRSAIDDLGRAFKRVDEAIKALGVELEVEP